MMKLFHLIRRILCLTAVLLVFACVCAAEEGMEIAEEGLDLSEQLSVHYPVIFGGADKELTGQVNGLIREKCRIEDWISRLTALMFSGGNLRVDWKAGILGDVFSCVVSAEGMTESTRPTYEWTAVSADLRDGHEITFDELFTDAEAAREKIETFLEEIVAPELSAHLQSSELTPAPELFYLERSGLTLLYPVSQLSTLSDRAGDLRIGWNVLKDVLDLGEESILTRIGVRNAVELTPEGARQLMADAAEGWMTDVPAIIGDSVQEMTDRYHLLTDPDGYEGGRLFALEGGCFRGIYLLTDDLTRSWEQSVVQGIRMDQGCLWGLCPGETLRTAWLDVLGEPAVTLEIDADKAEANRLVPGTCDSYRCGDHTLKLYSDEDGVLVSVILTL